MQLKQSFTQTVNNFMKTNVPTLSNKSTLLDAAKLFNNYKLRILPIMTLNNRFVGILTPSSLLKALTMGASINDSLFPYMIQDAITVHENDDLADARKRLLEKKVGGAVVLSNNNQFCGILDSTTIIQAYHIRNDSLTSSLETVIRHLQTGILALDPNGNILVANDAAEFMCDFQGEDVYGKHYSEVLPQLNINQSTNIPLHSIPVGNRKLLVMYKSLINTSNYWGGIILLQDLTDYEEIANELDVTKRLEKTLQTVLDTTYDGLIVIDQQGKITMINDTLFDLIQSSKEKVIDQSISAILPEINLEGVLVEDFKGEKIDPIIINNRRCIVKKIPIVKDEKHVGGIAKIIFKNLNEWKSVISRLGDMEKEISYYRGELSLIGSSPFNLEDIITRNKQMMKNKAFAAQIAPGFSNVLLLGESGTGKELFARGIHASSNRIGRFIKVNCAAIPENLWESEFFGYADGAFTGAKRGGKQGKFELADNGTIFLDEIGDMPLSMQVKILRVLQERELERVGGTKTIRVNVRVIAATNKDLKKMVEKNEFREDLYYRLNVIVIDIPPLRERKDDIPLLANSITKKFSHLMGIGTVKITDSAMALLQSHHWPGNVRELENTVERAMNCINNDIIEVEHLPEYIQNPKDKQNTIDSYSLRVPIERKNQEELTGDFFRNKKGQAEQEAIEIALLEAKGNRTAAAKLLGISRSQFYKKLNQYQIDSL